MTGRTEEAARWLAALGAELATRRVALGLPQREVAEHLSVARPCVSAYEAGQVDVPVTTLVRLAEMYGIRVSTLLAAVEDRLAGGWKPKSRNPMVRSTYAR